MFRGLRALLAVGTAFISLFTSTARAGDHHAEADIDTLHADLLGGGGSEWTMAVRYKVEIEHAAPGERFTLLLQPREGDYAIADDRGRALTFAVPLEQATKLDGDEITFEGRTELTLRGDALRDPRHAELQAYVTHDGEQDVLDDEHTDAEFHGERFAPIEATLPVGATCTTDEHTTIVEYQHERYEPTVVIDRQPTVVVERRPTVIVQRPRPTIVVNRPAVVVREPLAVVTPRPVIVAPRPLLGPRVGVSARVEVGDRHPRLLPSRHDRDGVRVNVRAKW